ncbi:MAG TPA: hypothetical protein VGP90_01135 [Acidimicrobiia bacterium]|nr:hypothetical protein [Acidimicrobiia bacterium]
MPPYIPSSETASPGSAALSDLLAGDPGFGPPAADPGQTPAAADADAPLMAAISRLTQSGSIPDRPDRRPVTFIAIALLVLNGAALSAINRKGAGSVTNRG